MQKINFENTDKRCDLHCHSTFSDGTLTPAELVKLAEKSNISALALTDHDTVAGCEAMRIAAEKHGLEWMQGCEFTVRKPYGICGICPFGQVLPRPPQHCELAQVVV